MISSASVIGLGKLGASMAACFAGADIKTIGVDINPASVEAVNAGLAPVEETGLAQYIAENKQNLSATLSYDDAVAATDATFVIVPTPSEAHGGFSLAYAKEAFAKIGRALAKKDGYHIVVMTSTVLPGGTEFGLLPILEQESGKKCGPDFGLCYSPEFIALGSVIKDFLSPDFVLIGEVDDRSGAALEAFYQQVCINNPPAARMSIANAELTKMSVNSFMTMKISFANMLAGLCDRIPGGDVDNVTSALAMFGGATKSLKGGLGYGGPCLPRDNVALSYFADSVGYETGIPLSVDGFNRSLGDRVAEKAMSCLSGGKKVTVLGLAYKPGTWVVEESQGVSIAKSLADRGFDVTVHDPLALENAQNVLRDAVTYEAELASAVDGANLVIVTTLDDAYAGLPAMAKFMSQNASVLDVWRRFAQTDMTENGVTLVSLGLGEKNKANIDAVSALAS